MLCVILFILQLSNVNAQDLNETSKYANPEAVPSESQDRVPLFGNFSPIPNLNAIPFQIAIYGPWISKWGGGGEALNRNWMITSGYVAKRINIYDYFLYENILDPRTLPTDITTVRRVIQRIKIHESYTESISTIKVNLALIRACPSFSMNTFATIPPASQVYTVDSDVDLYIYNIGSNDLRKANNKIVADSVCSVPFASVYDSSIHYCIKAINDLYLVDYVDFYKTSFVMQGGQYLGIVTQPSSYNNYQTMVMKMEAFSSWINANMN